MSETSISYSETPIWDPATYDAQRRRLVPSFDLLYGTVGDLVARTDVPSPTVLDLGCGTGLLGAAVLSAVPAARLHLFDGAAAMLERARARLSAESVTAATVADLTGALPAGPFDAVVSGLAIHHLDDPGKQDLFARIAGVLRPGGLFVNLEQVDGPSPTLTRLYADMHERHARSSGSDDAEWQAALGRMAFDRCASLADQLGWLTDAGFAPVDCIVRDGRFAVYAGWRA
ncbi:trans-aconitate 2-methyltransferase [Frankia sp. AiPa1]|uniref:class I SAM-dependent methyltransferase n=1 Tax=Frankia sp. AiPa1 TaxID=573492 RepID=UPI00202B2670|nr:class I SAM-dependent methyltransferase [Frankia sp. AiPa1]MCL9760598.1 class I SAM-dependent methyltransferase [Frankia sp. AiPa1]